VQVHLAYEISEVLLGLMAQSPFVKHASTLPQHIDTAAFESHGASALTLPAGK
jgi:hypothetical protein